MVLTIRDFGDSPYPWADSAFTNPAVKNLNTFAQQSVALRDAAIGKYLADADAFEDDDVKLIKNGEVGAVIWVKASKMNQGADKIFTRTAQVQASPDDYRNRAIIKQDMDETLGISAVQSGTPESTVRSATEIASVQTAVSQRNDKEQSRVIDFYLDLVRKVDCLLMRYADEYEWIHYVGMDGTKRLQAWNGKLLAGKWSYDIAPDSQLRQDTAQDRQYSLNAYNLLSRDPLVNRLYIIRRLARTLNMDPMELAMNPQNPQALSQIQTQAQFPHGGPGEAVNQHQSAQSGGRPNQPGNPNHRAAQNAQQPPQSTPPTAAGNVQVPGVPGHQ